jgi:hypothetical protein
MHNSTDQIIGEASIISLMPQLRIIAVHFNLKLSNLKDFKIAKKALINSIKNN